MTAIAPSSYSILVTESRPLVEFDAEKPNERKKARHAKAKAVIDGEKPWERHKSQ